MSNTFRSIRSGLSACSWLLLHLWCLHGNVHAYSYVATTQNGTTITYTAYAQIWDYSAKVADVTVSVPGTACFSGAEIVSNLQNQPAVPPAYGPNMSIEDFDKHIEFFGCCSWSNPWLVHVRSRALETWEWIDTYDQQGNLFSSEKRGGGSNSLMGPDEPFVIEPFPMMAEAHVEVYFQSVNVYSSGGSGGIKKFWVNDVIPWQGHAHQFYDSDWTGADVSGVPAGGTPLTKSVEMPHMTLQLDMNGNVVTFNLAPLPGVGPGDSFVDANGTDPIPRTVTGSSDVYWEEDWGNGPEVMQDDSGSWSYTINWGGTGPRPVRWYGTYADELNGLGVRTTRSPLPNYSTSGMNQVGWLVTYSVDEFCPAPPVYTPEATFADYWAHVYQVGATLGSVLQSVPIYSD